jgi:hypothetical protein
MTYSATSNRGGKDYVRLAHRCEPEAAIDMAYQNNSDIDFIKERREYISRMNATEIITHTHSLKSTIASTGDLI